MDIRPSGFPAQLTTQSERSKCFPVHDHEAMVDVNGNGNTDTQASHFHRVRNWRVLPDQSDGHTHKLTGLPAGDGLPNRRGGF